MSWSTVAARMQFGRLVGKDGWSYSFRPGDLPWSARFVMGEKEGAADTEESALLLWTMANRMYLVKRWETYSELLVAYSTPLHDPDAGTRPSAEVAARRHRIRALEPDDIPAGALRRVVAFLEGKVQVPAIGRTFVHFAQCGSGDPSLGAADYRSPTGECYWSVPTSRAWPAGAVRAVPASGGRSGAVPVLGGLLVLASILAATILSGGD